MEYQNKPRIVQIIINNKELVGEFHQTFPDIRLRYRTIMIITACYRYSNRMEDKWKRIEDFERNPKAYGHLIFDQIAKNHPVEIRQHFQ